MGWSNAFLDFAADPNHENLVQRGNISFEILPAAPSGVSGGLQTVLFVRNESEKEMLSAKMVIAGWVPNANNGSIFESRIDKTQIKLEIA